MKNTMLLTVLLSTVLLTAAQNNDEEQIKKVIRAETEAFFNRNLEAWKATWAQDPQVSRTIIANNYHSYQLGWDSAAAGMARNFKNSPAPVAVNIENKNYNIRTDGKMAWVHYDQRISMADNNSSYDESHEYRVLVKEGDLWKLLGQVTTFPKSFDLSNAAALESSLNETGYALLRTGKTDQAIELFKLNVKMFPDSWNVYDSLGEAYAQAGNKTLAIENYERSVKMNPKNETGTQALARLKSQK